MLFAAGQRILRQQFRVMLEVLRQRHRIEDQHDVARAQHRGAGDARHACQLRAHMLDHDFAVAHHVIDLQGQPVIAIPQQQHGRMALRGLRRRRLAQHGRQVVQRQRLPVRLDAPGRPHLLQLLAFQVQHLLHQHRWQGIRLAVGRQQHYLRHGQGQRQVDGEAHAQARLRQRFHSSAQGQRFGAHDVHAKTAPCQFRQAVGGGKTGHENQFGGLRVGQRRIRRHQAGAVRLGADAFQVQPRAVVGKGDCHFIALLADLHQQLARLALARSQARLARLDAVHDGVAQQVLKRCRHAFEYAAVDFYAAAADIEVDALVDFLGALPRHAEQPFGDAGKRHHADLHQVALQLARQARLQHQVVRHRIDTEAEVFMERGHVVDAFGHHAREFLQARKAIEFERVEFALAADGHARGDLRFSLHFHFAQLAPQARQVVGKLG